MYTVDIHKYNENRKSAIEELKIAISFGKREADHCVKVIVGYGSSGGTHIIKNEVLSYLEEKKGHGIKDYILSSDLYDYTPKFFTFKYSHFIPDSEKRVGNSGVIYIIV